MGTLKKGGAIAACNALRNWDFSQYDLRHYWAMDAKMYAPGMPVGWPSQIPTGLITYC